MKFTLKSEIVKHALANGQVVATKDVSKSGNLFFIHVDGITSQVAHIATGVREYYGPGASRAEALHNIFKESNVKV